MNQHQIAGSQLNFPGIQTQSWVRYLRILSFRMMQKVYVSNPALESYLRRLCVCVNTCDAASALTNTNPYQETFWNTQLLWNPRIEMISCSVGVDMAMEHEIESLNVKERERERVRRKWRMSEGKTTLSLSLLNLKLFRRLCSFNGKIHRSLISSCFFRFPCAYCVEHRASVSALVFVWLWVKDWVLLKLKLCPL